MKVLCVICPNKVKLEQTDSFMFICPKCKRSYNLYYEIMNFSDEIESTYDEEGNIELAGLNAGTTGLLSANDDNYPTLDDIMEEQHNKGKKIPIPKYMKNGTVTRVEHFQEEIN